ncbi:dual specificity protein phosphatase 13A isoform X2 [Phyllobates terribilis]|uniref:dual specificity protein phosphatase 13A isoform X2 n=1 Tax=Phyllobates terribilis TaxID=111132 RepID=UPI003CCB2D3B
MAEKTEQCSSLSRREDSQADVCPTVAQLQNLLDSRRTSFSHRVDEVWPNLFLGDLKTANDKYELWKLGITHVLSAAHGRRYSEGNPDFYGTSITYHGVPANDVPEFDMSKYFYSAAAFIHKALTSPGAIRTVQEKRWISPNTGFLRQLIHLDEELRQTQQNQTKPEANQHGEEVQK